MTDAPLPPAEDRRRKRAGWLVLLLLTGIASFVLGALLFEGDDADSDVISQRQSAQSSVVTGPKTGPVSQADVTNRGRQAAGKPSPAPTVTVTVTAAGTNTSTPTTGTAGGSGTVTIPGQCGNCEGNNGNGGGNTGGTGPKSLTVVGVVTSNVGPGASVPMTVTVTNVGSRRIDLTSVRGTVTSVTTRNLPDLFACDKAWYSIGTFTGSRSLDKGASTTLTLPVRFDNRAFNQDNCKGATYTYSLTATGQGA